MTSGASRPRKRLFWLAGALILAVAAMAAVVLLSGAPTSDDPGRPPSGAGRVLWNGDLSTGDLSQYTVQECAPGRTTVVDDPIVSERKAIRFTVRDTDVAPCTPTENPRAQALSPSILRPGGDYWIGWSVLVPNDYPVTRGPGDNWTSLGSVYGPPADGPSGTGLALTTNPGRERFYYRRGEAYDFDEPWSMPLVRGRWVDFVFHMKLSTDPEVGFREQWVNTGSGWRQSQLAGAGRLFTETLNDANDGGPNVSKISLYRKRRIMEVATLFFAAHRIGTSFDAVAPATYGDR